MRLLITGGCGFLGSNLAADALRCGDELLVLDNLSRLGARENLEWLRSLGNFRFVQADVRNAETTAHEVALFAPEAIFHLAGQVAMTTSIRDPRMDFEVNALGTLNVLEAMRASTPEAAMIYSSTNKIYGDLEQYTYRETPTRYECIDHPCGFDEHVPLDFHSPYGCSKGAADQYVLDYARIYGLKTVVFRHSSMYGGRQFATFDQGWIGWFCAQALKAKAGQIPSTMQISGSGKQVRDLLYADDMVNLYRATLAHIDRARGQAFNVGGGQERSLSLLELFELIEELLEMRLGVERLPPRSSDQRVFVADIRKAVDLLGWSPAVSTRSGVARMLQWVEADLLSHGAH